MQHVIAQDKEVRYIFCSDFLSRLGDDHPFTAIIVSSDVAIFHLSGNVNRQNLKIWGANILMKLLNIRETFQNHDIYRDTVGALVEHL
jgi:hypothetical protein